jgi:hypothetical protein
MLPSEQQPQAPATFDQRIAEVESACLQLPQVDCPVRHHFYPGIYMREVNIPAGTFAVGHEQRTEHLNFFAKGCVTVVNEDGSLTLLRAPLVYIGKPGRKVGFIHEDVQWYNIYPTNETDVEKLEATYLNKSPGFLASNQDLAVKAIAADSEDYESVVRELGMTQDDVNAIVLNESDIVDMPSGSYKFQFAPSPIHGRGTFAVGAYSKGEEIGVARIGGKRTPLGRYVNHSKTPNATALFDGDNVYFHATRDIGGNRGGLLGEEITIDYRIPLSKIYNFQFK